MFRVAGLNIGGFKSWDFLFSLVKNGLQWNEVEHALKELNLSYQAELLAPDYKKAKYWADQWKGLNNVNFNKYFSNERYAYSPTLTEGERMVTIQARVINPNNDEVEYRNFTLKSGFNKTRSQWIKSAEKLLQDVSKITEVQNIDIQALYKGW